MVKAKQKIAENENGQLRAEFTSWLNTVLYRAKLKYIRNTQHKLQSVSLNDADVQQLADPTDRYAKAEEAQSDFAFEEERLARAFRELPLVRREVLRLLFVEEMSPKEVAVQLNCSESYVRQHKSRAIKKLRQQMMEESTDDEQ